jgi:hypothetical protein
MNHRTIRWNLDPGDDPLLSQFGLYVEPDESAEDAAHRHEVPRRAFRRWRQHVFRVQVQKAVTLQGASVHGGRLARRFLDACRAFLRQRRINRAAAKKVVERKKRDAARQQQHQQQQQQQRHQPPSSTPPLQRARPLGATTPQHSTRATARPSPSTWGSPAARRSGPLSRDGHDDYTALPLSLAMSPSAAEVRSAVEQRRRFATAADPSEYKNDPAAVRGTERATLLSRGLARLRLWRRWRRYNHRLAHACAVHRLLLFFALLRRHARRRKRRRQRAKALKKPRTEPALRQAMLQWRQYTGARTGAPERHVSLYLHARMLQRSLRRWRHYAAARAGAPERLFSLFLHAPPRPHGHPRSRRGRTALDNVHLLVVGRAALQRWRAAVFSWQTWRAVGAQGAAVHLGALALRGLRALGSHRARRRAVREGPGGAAFGAYAARVLRAMRALRALRGLVQRRQVARGGGDTTLDRRRPRRGRRAGPAVRYFLVDEAVRLRRALRRWRQGARASGRRRRAAARELSSWRTLWCAVALDQLLHHRARRQDAALMLVPVNAMQRQNALRRAWTALRWHRRVSFHVRRHAAGALVCVARLRQRTAVALRTLARHARVCKSRVVAAVAELHMVGYRVAWLVRRWRTVAAQATFLRTVLVPQVPQPHAFATFHAWL